MTEVLQLLKDFDAVGVAALVLILAKFAIDYLRAEIKVARKEKAELVLELRASHQLRLEDKQREADDRVQNAVRLESVVSAMTRATETNQVVLARMARKLQVED